MDAADGTSYFVEVDGVQLDAGKILSAHFDDETGKFVFRDNDGNEDKYDVDFERILLNGTEQDYETDDIETGKVDSYEMDFGKWDGKSDMCFRDNDGNGFANDECEAQPEEDNDDDADAADDAADDEDSDVDNDGKLNDADPDDDGDGTPDDKDTDDDNDGESDSEDDDDNGEGDDNPGILSFLQWR